MGQLLDKDGIVHEQGAWSGQWKAQHGWFGTEKDTDWLGRPNVDRDFWGNPKEARDSWGRPISSEDGSPLYESSGWSGGGGGGGSGLTDALAVGLTFLLLAAAAALVALLFRLLAAVYRGWRGLVERYPTAMLIVHLALAMALVAGTLRVAGFDLAVQGAGAAGVILLWLWLRLTRRLPLIFMPINALIAGAALYLGALQTEASWQPTWSRLAEGLPIADRLPWLLALLPLAVWLWALANERLPGASRPLNALVLGALLWFLLMRAWPGWLPYWQAYTAPVPGLPSVGWLIFLAPLVLWLLRLGGQRWPLPFTALNLLVFGGLLGLTALHTRPLWAGTWRHWMAGLPVVGYPILAIGLAPAALWGWGVASRRWSQILAIPNLLITGGIFWLILDRTRGLWETAWARFWGEVPLAVDPAWVALALPLALWAWGAAGRRWPRAWGLARALLWGAILWWIAERTRLRWQVGWQRFGGESVPDLARIAAGAPVMVWVLGLLHGRWPRATNLASCVLVGSGLAWCLSRLFPAAHVSLFLAGGLLPLALLGWLWLLRRSWQLGLGLAALPVFVVMAAGFLAPSALTGIASGVATWLARYWFVSPGH